MLKTIGQKKKNEATTQAGIEAIQEFWKERGLSLEGWMMEDGSGLSPRNAITAKQLATILAKLSKDGSIYPHIKASLSTSGTRRMKSGSMDRVRCYAGYIQTKSGKMLSFSLLANNYLDKSKGMRHRWGQIFTALNEL